MRYSDSPLLSHARLLRRVAGATALALAGFLGTASPVHAQSVSPPGMLLDLDARIPFPREGRSSIVVMKLQGDTASAGSAAREGTASIFIDGNYQASLPKPSWSQADVCPGMHSIGAVADKSILSVVEGRPFGQQFDLAPASTTYFQLIDDAQGDPRLETLAAEAALAAATDLPRAAHTISRLPAVECAPPVEASPPAQPMTGAGAAGAATGAGVARTSNYTLRYSAFFDFDGFLVKAQHGDSQAELDEIIRKLRTAYLTVQHIEIFGYADPSGTAAYNLALSRKRADAVSQYLAQAGFAAATITAKGMGATSLAVHDCASRGHTPQQIHACNEPNRRVELVVHGQARN